ncbi:MAG: hypothetical protein P9L99_02435 [Candidatus Lernaella stagnicola]|nr:hypothetical protein [Candidatus Lernaella stagnicola]
MRKIVTFLFLTCLAAVALSAPVWTVSARQGSDGEVYWRAETDGLLRWELADLTGDGRPDVALFHSGEKIVRTEIDTNADGVADRVALFMPDRSVSHWRDADGNGVLESAAAPVNDSPAAVLYRRAVALRYAARDGQFPAHEGELPPVTPPFTRPIGTAVSVQMRLSLLSTDGASRRNPQDVGLVQFEAAPGRGEHLVVPVSINAEGVAAQAGTLDLMTYAVWCEKSSEKRLRLEAAGRLVVGDSLNEELFFVVDLTEETTSALHMPLADGSGNASRSLLVEIRRR